MVPRALVVQSRPDVARAVSASLADAEVHAVVLADGHARRLGGRDLGPARRARRPDPPAARRLVRAGRASARWPIARCSSCGWPMRPRSTGRSRWAPTPGSTTMSTWSPRRADWRSRSPPDREPTASVRRVVGSGIPQEETHMPDDFPRPAPQDRRRVAGAAHARAVPGRPQGRHRAGVHRRVLGLPRRRRRTSACAAATPLFSSETKFESGTGWPSFFQALESGRGRGGHRHEPRHGAHRGALPQLRRPPRPRVPRRSPPDRSAVLHEQRLAAPRSARSRRAADPAPAPRRWHRSHRRPFAGRGPGAVPIIAA